jgi:superfamily II DNA or RNA helicase
MNIKLLQRYLVPYKYLPLVKKRYTYRKNDDTVMHNYAVVGTKYILLPRNLPKLKSLLGNVEVDDLNVSVPISRNIVESIVLRDYQVIPFNNLVNNVYEHKDIMFKAGTGFGKSIIISKLIATVKQKTLILVDRGILKNQLISTIKSTITNINVGDLKDGKGYDVTVATLQYCTRNISKIESIDVGLVGVDEAHTIPAEKFQAVLNSVKRKYTVLFTATPTRSDGLTELLTDNYSYMVEGSNPDVIVQDVYVYTYNKHWYLSHGSYLQLLENYIMKDEELLKDIVNVVNKCVKINRKFILSTHTITLQEFFKELLSKNNVKCVVINSNTPITSTLYKDLQSNKVHGIIGFGSISKGFDIDILDTLIHVSGATTKENVEQLVGRILRVNSSKRSPIVFDFHVKGNLEKQQDIRLKYYTTRCNTVKYISK